MSRLLLFAIGFLVGFSLDVRVQAAERAQLRNITVEGERANRHSSALLEEPANCLDDKMEGNSPTACSIQVGHGRRLSLAPDAGRTWLLGEDTIIVRKAPTRVHLVHGVIRVQGEVASVETELGSIRAQGEVYVERYGNRTTVINMGDGDVVIVRRGTKSEEHLPSGFQIELTRPDVKTGVVMTGLPLPFDYDMQVVREARFYSGEKAAFEDHLRSLAELRRAAAVVGSELHEKNVQRKIASLVADEERRKIERRKRDARDRELRALFRKRSLDIE